MQEVLHGFSICPTPYSWLQGRSAFGDLSRFLILLASGLGLQTCATVILPTNCNTVTILIIIISINYDQYQKYAMSKARSTHLAWAVGMLGPCEGLKNGEGAVKCGACIVEPHLATERTP